MSQQDKPTKTKQQYSRNVKILKLKLSKLNDTRSQLQEKISNAKRSTNDRIIALKFSKFCKQRNFTPQMIFRFADKNYNKQVNHHQFKTLLQKLGIKFSNDQLLKLMFLLDENISGSISVLEYYHYLSAFNIRVQASSEQPFVLTSLEKLNKILIKKGVEPDEITKINREKQKQKQNIEISIKSEEQTNDNDKHMMDYDQFYRYCKAQLQMSDKQLMSIFNRFDPQNKGKISIQQLKLFLIQNQKKQVQLKRKNTDDMIRAAQKKRKGQITKKQSKYTDLDLKKRISKNKILDGQKKQLTLQNKLKLIISSNKYKNKHFYHLNDFKKVSDNLGPLYKLQFYQLFKEIDTSKKGSLDHNQIINYYLNKRSQIDSLDYTYQLINQKLQAGEHHFDQLLYIYNINQQTQMTDKIFSKIMRQQFQINDKNAADLYNNIISTYKDKKIIFRVLKQKINNQLNQQQINLKNLLTINYFGTKPIDFFKTHKGTILKNPLVAFQFCLQLQAKLLKQNLTFWTDYQFGPNYTDRSGINSLVSISNTDKVGLFPSESQLSWLRTIDLGFNDFYFDQQQPTYLQGKCNNLGFLSALKYISQQDKRNLWNQLILNQPKIQKLTQNQLDIVFMGIYPKIFHPFAKYGIYVFRMYIKQTWVYIMIDDKIPCLKKSKQPLFSISGTKKYSWISLIQKAYAKAHGSYYEIYNKSNTIQCLYQLGRLINYKIQIPNPISQIQIKDKLWIQILTNQNIKMSNMKAINTKKTTFLNYEGFQTNFIGMEIIQSIAAFQIPNPIANNYHKSHRLFVVNLKKNHVDSQWNSQWSRKLKDSKFYQNEDEINEIIRKKKLKINLSDQSLCFINYQKFRSFFDILFFQKKVDIINNECFRFSFKLQKPIKIKISPKQKSKVLYTISVHSNQNCKYQQNIQNLKQANAKKSINSNFQVFENQMNPINYILTINSSELLKMTISFYFQKKGKVGIIGSNDIQIQEIKQNIKFPYELQNRDKKTNQYLQKMFKIPPKKGFWCC